MLTRLKLCKDKKKVEIERKKEIESRKETREMASEKAASMMAKWS
jgi:hypothetical protein